MTAKIAPLAHRETPRITYEAMLMLQQNLGLATSRDVIERAVFELSDRLARLELALEEDRLQAVQTLAIGMIAISTQIGLTEFADVAADLVFCIDCENTVAIQAVAARLIRLGERSMSQAVQFAETAGG